MEFDSEPCPKIEVKLQLHPTDHDHAMNAAQAVNLGECDFYALAIHLGTLAILESARHRCAAAARGSRAPYQTGNGLRSAKPS